MDGDTPQVLASCAPAPLASPGPAFLQAVRRSAPYPCRLGCGIPAATRSPLPANGRRFLWKLFI